MVIGRAVQSAALLPGGRSGQGETGGSRQVLARRWLRHRPDEASQNAMAGTTLGQTAPVPEF